MQDVVSGRWREIGTTVVLPGNKRQLDAVGFLRDEEMTSCTLGRSLQLAQNLMRCLESCVDHKEVKLVSLVVGIARLEPDNVCAVCVHVSHPSNALERNFK